MKLPKHLTLVVGARPNFMKIASICHALSILEEAAAFDYTLVHTGQHYDQALSEVFLTELELPVPDVNFGVGSSNHAQQTAEIMIAFDAHLDQTPTDCVVVVGDVNSTLACALVASKKQVPVAHVEAGLESGDRSMPEEINRLATDAIADFFFCTSDFAVKNLRRRGAPAERTFLVGNTMIDTLLRHRDKTRRPACWSEQGLQPESYAVCTIHRPRNVDSLRQLEEILDAIATSARRKVIFPVHPRTQKQLRQCEHRHANLILTDPLSYLEFLHLTKQARYVVTDSGGIQEETTFLGVPCITVRPNTERPETVEIGTNELVGCDTARLHNAIEKVEQKRWKEGQIPPLWDGKAGQRIVAHLSELLN